jgi:hypothetical protein
MFGKQLTHIAQGIAIAAAVAAVAVPSAFAGANSGDRTRAQVCQGDGVWITITDDLGLSQLVPAAHGPCTAEATCTSSAQTGWITVTDDLGLPSLVQSGQTDTTVSCVLARSSSPGPASKIVKAKITKSTYQGWVFLTDTTDSAKLVSRSNLRG